MAHTLRTIGTALLLALLASANGVAVPQRAEAATGDCVTVVGKGGMKRNGYADVCLRRWYSQDGRQYARLAVRQHQRSAGERVYVKYRFLEDGTAIGRYRRLGPSSHRDDAYARRRSVAGTADGVAVRLCYDRPLTADRCFAKKVVRGTPTGPAPTPGPEVHVVHAVPAGANPVSGIAGAIRHEVGLIDGWYRSQTGGLAPRWERTSTGGIRVRTVSLDLTRRQIEAASGTVITNSLTAALDLEANELAIVYLDAAAVACGYSEGPLAVAMMASCGIYPSTATPSFPYGSTYLVAHELTHAMGAVPSCAPNAIKGGHVGNDNRDLLYEGGQQRDWANLMLDPGRDDYFRHGRSDCPDIADHPIWAP